MHGYFRPDYPTYGQIGAVAVSSDYLYWGDAGGPAIRRARWAGARRRSSPTAWGRSRPLAVDAANLYWTADTEGVAPAGVIGRLGLAGGTAEPN